MNILFDPDFEFFNCDKGISSEVFVKDGYIYKVTVRNSLERAKKDYEELREILKSIGYEHKLQNSEILSCFYKDQPAVCIKQKLLSGKTVSKLSEQEFKEFLLNNPEEIVFFRRMIEVFLKRVNLKQLYPDLVGNPNDQSILNSINLIVEPERGLVICDVGLSPHEDTVEKYGADFFLSENVCHYKAKMQESLEFLVSLEDKSLSQNI